MVSLDVEMNSEKAVMVVSDLDATVVDLLVVDGARTVVCEL